MTSSIGLPSRSRKVCCPSRSIAAAGAVLTALTSPTAMLSVATVVPMTWALHCNLCCTLPSTWRQRRCLLSVSGQAVLTFLCHAVHCALPEPTLEGPNKWPVAETPFNKIISLVSGL